VTARKDRRYLAYIQESIRLIERYSAGGRDRFLTDTWTSDAILHRLETLADAAGRLSDALKQRHPDIPWRHIVGFRNVVAHAYLDVELPRVWEVIVGDLPPLLAVVDQELARFNE